MFNFTNSLGGFEWCHATQKISFEDLDKEVTDLYNESIDPKDIRAIDAQCLKIANVIKRYGWTEQEYFSKLYSFNNTLN